MMKWSYCRHCSPEIRYHFRRKILNLFEYFVFHPIIYILSRAFLLSEHDFIWFESLLNKLYLITFKKLKLLTKTNNLERKQFNNSILALWDEAQKRGLEIYNFKESKLHTPYFILVINSKKYYFMQTPISLIYQKSTLFDNDIKYDNKWIFKKKLSTNQIPCPLGKMFISSRRAYKYGLSIGFPLVAKPISESLGVHVICNIQTPDELKKAIKIVKQVDCRVLIERHIPGDVYRCLIINNSLVACVMREPEKIIGDGVSTVQELIERKNTGVDCSQISATYHN